MDLRVGYGQDTHCLVENRDLILGGVKIEHSLGLLGHSDADLVLHALCDALLGAAGLGDIGEHFPDTDPKWKGADSSKLLQEVLRMVQEQRWQVQNCDITICCEAPRLKDHKANIRQSVAGLLKIETNACNIKAKTHEGKGPVGRQEVMESHCVVLLTRPSSTTVESRES